MQRLAGSITLSSGWKRTAIALAAGAFQALALPPFGIFIVGFIAFSVLLLLIDGASADMEDGFLRRRLPAFSIGWAFGFGYFVAGTWWTANAMLVEADQFGWAVPLAALGLPAYLAIFYGLAAMLAQMFWIDGVLRLFALAAFLAAAEWLRGHAFTGFPWNSVGQALMPFPLMMQSISVVGAHTMDLVAILIFAAPAVLLTRRQGKLAIGIACLLLSTHLGFGAYRLYFTAEIPPASTTIRLVQPSISQADKLDDGERAKVFEAHLTLTKGQETAGKKRPDLVIWPETSIPFILTENPDALSRIADVLEDGQILISGAVRTEAAGAGKEPLYYNSIYAIDSQGQIIGATDKVHLVPFGEYLPFESFFEKLDMSAVAAMPGGFSAASERKTLTMPDGKSFLPLICYEIIFPDEIPDNEIQNRSALLNVTNDEWFGNSPGPWQHFLQARLRAVETGLPLIRAANSGISAVVDAKGRVLKGLNFSTKGYIDTTMPSTIGTLTSQTAKMRLFLGLELLILLILSIARMSFIFKRN